MLGFGVSFSQDFLCRPWVKMSEREQFGESFRVKIENGDILLIGSSNPVNFAKLIYSHPLYDVFMAASGEIITAGVSGLNIKVKIYFPNEDNFYFITTKCTGI
jgi:hypothetical protein